MKFELYLKCSGEHFASMSAEVLRWKWLHISFKMSIFPPIPVIALLLLLVHSGQAGVVYEDGFTGPVGTKLNSRGPDIFSADTTVKYLGGDGPRILRDTGVTLGNSVVSLPLPPIKKGEVISVSLGVKAVGENPFGYIGVGFTSAAKEPLSTNGLLWANVMNGGYMRVWQGPSEPKGEGLLLYGSSASVAAPSIVSELILIFDTQSGNFSVTLDSQSIFEGSIDFPSLESLRFLTIQFNGVSTSNDPEASCIDNLKVSIDPAP